MLPNRYLFVAFAAAALAAGCAKETPQGQKGAPAAQGGAADAKAPAPGVTDGGSAGSPGGTTYGSGNGASGSGTAGGDGGGTADGSGGAGQVAPGAMPGGAAAGAASIGYLSLTQSSPPGLPDALTLLRQAPNWRCDDATQTCSYQAAHSSGFSPSGTNYQSFDVKIDLDYQVIHPLARIEVEITRPGAGQPAPSCYLLLDPASGTTSEQCETFEDRRLRQRHQLNIYEHGPGVAFHSDIVDVGQTYLIRMRAVDAAGTQRIVAQAQGTLTEETLTLPPPSGAPPSGTMTADMPVSNGPQQTGPRVLKRRRISVPQVNWQPAGAVDPQADFFSGIVGAGGEPISGREPHQEADDGDYDCPGAFRRDVSDHSGPQYAGEVHDEGDGQGSGSSQPSPPPLFQKFYLAPEALGLTPDPRGLGEPVTIGLGAGDQRTWGQQPMRGVSCEVREFLATASKAVGASETLHIIRHGRDVGSCDVEVARLDFTYADKPIMVTSPIAFTTQVAADCTVTQRSFTLNVSAAVTPPIPADYVVTVRLDPSHGKPQQPLWTQQFTPADLAAPIVIPELALASGDYDVSVRVADTLGVDCRTHTIYVGHATVQPDRDTGAVAIGLTAEQETRHCAL